MTGWTADEKKAIAAVLVEAFEMQRTYGETLDMKIRGRAWERKLGAKFSVNQIIMAIEKYTDRHSDFPTPSDIINILAPEKPEISKAEYIAAKEWLKINGYNQFSDQYELVQAFEKQEKDKRAAIPQELSHLTQLAAQSIKKLEKS